ncbi:MAG: YgiQ family radical SAM protein [Candidatus Omnitrophota bacterium]
MSREFLPISLKDVKKRGWSGLDVIIISGDAYVDHHSYGAAVIGRVLEASGFYVGIIAQPDWRSKRDFMKLGKPRLFFGITSGNTDSMIANYTANKRRRLFDQYSPGNRAGLRPDRAVIVYANRVREIFGDVPIVIGGIEASLRRLIHYDYWDNCLRRSILIDSRADILVYGMGEQQVVEIARRLDKGITADCLDGIRGTAVVRKDLNRLGDYLNIPSFEEIISSKDKYNQAFIKMYGQMNPLRAKTVIQQHGRRWVVVFPPALPLSSGELDKIYELPYAGYCHSVYDNQRGVKGFETVRFSLTSHRGCCGECSFCALYFHQGRIVQSRSIESLEREARALSKKEGFKGTITDIGGPTANMYAMECNLWIDKNFCRGKKCLIPKKCEGLKVGYKKSLEMYRRIRKIPGIKHLFIASGMRYDLLTEDYARQYLEEVCKYHVSGQLKVAPEHCSDSVLGVMNKPPFSVYEKFLKIFSDTVKRVKKNLFLVNYFITAHPASSLDEALKLSLYLSQKGICPEQIQDFIPAPMTLSSCIYWTGKDPFSQKDIYVPKTFRERKMQRALLQYNNPANERLIREALFKLKAQDRLPRLMKRRKARK